jgi:AraC-like DNA-binding protein
MTAGDQAPIRLLHTRGDRALYRGMKDCLGFVVVRQGWLDVAHGASAPHREHAGGLVVVQPGEVYCEHRRSADSALDVLLLPGRSLDSRLRAESGFVRLGHADPRTRAVVRLIDAVRTRADALGVETAVCEATRNMAISEPRSLALSRERSAVEKAKELLLDRFRENVRLDELAEHAGLDKYHLVRAFRARHGVPPYEYLTHARILFARKLLLRGKRPSDVAAAVGYCDQSQLHRHFVRIVGITPGRYRAAG